MKKFSRRSLLFLVSIGALFSPGAFALADTPVTGNITANTTWTTAGSVYTIENAISINSGVTLTINPGVIVKFRNTSASITVNGALHAQGTATSSIYFTSIKDDTIGGDTNADGSATSPAAGNWGYIFINSNASTTFNYAVVRYGGATYSTNLYNSGGTVTVENSIIASSTSYGIYHTSGATTIATSTFNNNGQYGVKESGSGTLSLTGSTFSDNSTAAGYFDLGSGLVFTNSGNTASGTGLRGFVMNGSMSANQTWQADTMPYIISSSGLTVSSGKTLTVNQGAIVKFEYASSSQLYVSGTLTAQGTAASPIYFTSIADDTVGGDTNGDNSATAPASANWGNIRANTGGATTFDYAIVRYGGGLSDTNIYTGGGTLTFNNSTSTSAFKYGINHNSGTTNIATSTFSASGNYGVYGFGSGTVTIQNSNFSDNSTAAGYFYFSSSLVLSNSGNTASGTGLRGFIMYATMNANQTWQADTIPYIISSSGFTIPSGKILTINPDAVVKFESTASTLTVNGELSAVGNSLQNISFTSIKDDTIGGDTNGDGSATSPAAGNWQKIETGSGATTTLAYAAVRYGGYSNGWMLYKWGGVLNIATSTIANATSYGIYQTGGTTSVTGSTITNNGTEGFHNSLTSTSTATAANNFWGNASGPYNTKYNSSGTGNTVSDYVTFTPWLYATSTGPVLQGHVTSNTTISNVYVIRGNVTVDAGATITVNPGTVVKFDTATTSSLTVSGSLSAIGASTSKIYFTSLKDDTVGGDTNGDGSATTPSAGDWGKIQINSGGVAQIKHAYIFYAGTSGIYNSGTTTVQNIYMSEINTYGIYQASGGLYVKNSEITGMDYGVYSTGATGLGTGGSAPVQVLASDIHDVSAAAVYSAANILIDFSDLRDSYQGLALGGGNASVRSSRIFNNTNGVWVDGGEGSISSNSITDNSAYGIYYYSGGFVNADQNYWSNNTTADCNFSIYLSCSSDLEEPHYIEVDNNGNRISSVSGGTEIVWKGNPQYTTEWASSTTLWNGLGTINITENQSASSPDLTVSTTTRSDAPWGAQWQWVYPGSDTLEVNTFYMDLYGGYSGFRENVFSHELGHALGLGHSYYQNMMYLFVDPSTATTTLGNQDEVDYCFLWGC